MNKVYFYIPPQHAAQLDSQNGDRTKWKGISNNLSCWIWTTYLNLKKAGFPCETIDKIPTKGIVIADRDSLNDKYSYYEDLMLICAKADREFHPSAYLHVVQNPIDVQYYIDSIWNPHFIPHWSQPGIIPRTKERESQVKTVGYIGTRSQLAPELKSEEWSNALQELGCEWLPIFDPDKWNDYSGLDVIVAARSFGQATYPNKPASKLVNCWCAGTPAILTPESAFTSLKRKNIDFLEVESIDEAINAVAKLKHDLSLYNAMVENGFIRAKEFDVEHTTNRWIEFFEQIVFCEYSQYKNMNSWTKRKLFYQRIAQLKLNRLKNKFKF